MNYAQDRLDRRELLQSVLVAPVPLPVPVPVDHTIGIQPNPPVDHTKHGQVCMMRGWNQHALYHYGRAWYDEPTSGTKLGDYVQMMEIYGYPEIALLTIFLYRTLTTTGSTANTANTANTGSPEEDETTGIQKLLIPPPELIGDDTDDGTYCCNYKYDLSNEEMIGRHCGCRDRLCGKSAKNGNNHRTSDNPIRFPLWIPMPYTDMKQIVAQLSLYLHGYNCHTVSFQPFKSQQEPSPPQQQQQHPNPTANHDTTQQRQSPSTTTATTPTPPTTPPTTTTTAISSSFVPPTAHEILGDWSSSSGLVVSKVQQFIVTSQQRIPTVFQFWCPTPVTPVISDSSSDKIPITSHHNAILPPPLQNYRTLLPVVQLLCVKLLYLVVPSLAIEAMIHLRYQQHLKEQHEDKNHVNQNDWNQLSIQYKSHWAYYIFLEALVFGERMKPSRRRQMKYQHVALWDRLWGINIDVENMNGRAEPLSLVGKPPNSPIPLPQTQRNSIHQVGNRIPYHPHGSDKLVHDFVEKLHHLVDEIYHKLDDSDCHSSSNNNHKNDTDRNAILTQPDLPSPVQLPPILDHRPRSRGHQRPLFFVGDSHVLSLAWQSIYVPVSTGGNGATTATEPHLMVPIVITGLKAWHMRSEMRFFTNTCLHTMLRRIPRHVQTIVVSAGEIDCREGMGGPLLQGYTQKCYDHVKATVGVYLSSLAQIIQLPSNGISQILITPVAPHIERHKGRVVGQASRRETIRVWNDELRCQLQQQQNRSIYLLDYIDQIQVPIKKSNDIDRTVSSTHNVPYALNPIFNADSTHMNGAFVPVLQDAIIRCQCDLSKL